MAHDCIFCKIVQGDVPSSRVYEDEQTLAFLDIHPVNPGHTLVIPKRHALNVFEIGSDDWMAVARTIHRVAPALEQALGADGVNLVMNNRENAGQVVGHAHMHVIPRFTGDGLRPWSHGSYKEGEAEAVLKKITESLQ